MRQLNHILCGVMKMSWKVEYGTEKKRRSGQALVWIVGTVLVWSALVFGRGVVTEQLRAVETMVVRVQGGMPLEEAIQAFCREAFDG